MRKVAGNCDIALIDRSTAGRVQPLEQMRVAIGLSVVLIAGIQRAAAIGNSKNMIGALCCRLSTIQSLPPK
jgi:hypothetical protein